jgi:putative transposase
MPRTPRFIVPGLPHHITQRGNYRQPVFTSDGDRHFFLRRLNDRAQQYEIDVLAWCLMSNHFHLIAIPRREDSLALGLGALLSEYSLRMNTLRGEMRGHAWQSRYYSCALRRHHLWMALRYVELNPVRARIVEKPEQYPWSSAATTWEWLRTRRYLGGMRYYPIPKNGPGGWGPEFPPTRRRNYVDAPCRDGRSGRHLLREAAPKNSDRA